MENNKNRLLVHLLVRKGKKGVKGEGDIITERFPLKIVYGTMNQRTLKEAKVEWRNYLNRALSLGVFTLDIVKVQEIVGTDEYKDIETPDFIKKQVEDAMSFSESELTSEQIKIKALEEKLEKVMAMVGSTEPKKETLKNEVKSDAGNVSILENMTIEEARAKYEELFGKKPHHAKGVESIIEDIKNKK